MRALIFDLDGTLVESLPGIAGSLNRSLALLGLPQHTHEAVRGFIGDGAQKLVERALSGMSRQDLTAELLASFGKDYATTWPEGTRVYNGMHELLARLTAKGVPLAVLSNKPHAFTVEIVQRLFPEKTFAVTLGNREGLAHKPDPTGALEIASSLNLLPADCTLIGDSVIDLETAQNAGMTSIGVTWGYHDKARLHGAHQLAETIAELDQFLS